MISTSADERVLFKDRAIANQCLECETIRTHLAHSGVDLLRQAVNFTLNAPSMHAHPA
jgi:hypothetical protein